MTINPALQAVMASISKKEGNVLFSEDLPMRTVVPFTSPFLNEATRGGAWRGVFNELAGDEHTGKTTLALDAIKHYQEIAHQEYLDEKKRLEELIKTTKGAKQLRDLEDKLANTYEKMTLYMDLEHAINPLWVESIGVDTSPNRFMFYRPNTIGAEDSLDTVLQLVESGAFGAIVIDSVGVMISTAENESDLSKGNFGGISKALTKFYKKAIPLVGPQNIMAIMINQTREDMGGYGRFIRPGGKAHAFAQSTILRLRASSDHLYEENYKKGSGNSGVVWAKGIRVKVEKLKQASQRVNNTIYTIKVGQGIDRLYDTFHFSIQLNLIEQGGAWYQFIDPTTGEVLEKSNGEANALKYLKSHPDLLDKLWDACYTYSTTDIEED